MALEVKDIETITVDGVEKAVTEFSPEIQEMVATLNLFRTEELVARLELAKHQHAINSLSMNLEVKLKQFLNPVSEEVTEETVESVEGEVVPPTVQ